MPSDAPRRLAASLLVLLRAGVAAGARRVLVSLEVAAVERMTVDSEANRNTGRTVTVKTWPCAHPRSWASRILWGLPE